MLCGVTLQRGTLLARMAAHKVSSYHEHVMVQLTVCYLLTPMLLTSMTKCSNLPAVGFLFFRIIFLSR